MIRITKRLLCLLLCAVMLSSLLTACGPAASEDDDGQKVITPQKSGVVLNELMASNSTSITDNYGQKSDWIELYNSSDKPINLNGYMLSNNPSKPGKFTFGDVTLEAGGYLIVWASGRTEEAEPNPDYIHLPFKINKTSEIISLFSPGGAEIGRITVNNVPPDFSCGPNADGATVIFTEPTPGAKNVETTFKPAVTEPEIPLNTSGKDVITVRINEYATKNSITYADCDSDFGAWAELYNYGTAPVSLRGIFLSDDPAKTDKWAFPDVTIEPDSYLLVFLSGKTRDYGEAGELHADFTLSGKESTLGVYNGVGEAIDLAPVFETVSNVTYGRSPADPDTWHFFSRATPKAANTASGFPSIDSARYPSAKALVLSEFMAVNTGSTAAADGKYYDYIEIYNPTSEAVNLSAFSIGKKKDASRAIRLPEVTLAAGGYRVLYLSDATGYSARTDTIYLDLGLNRYGDDLYIFDENGVAIDSVNSGRLFDGTSSGRRSGEDDGIYFFESPTPGAANNAVALLGACGTPEITEGGYANIGDLVTISAEEGARIYYTTDGSYPTQNSQLYTGPITLAKTATIRAVAYKDGHLHSDDVSSSFLIGVSHTIPVVFLSSDPDNFFSGKKGILVDGDNFNPNAAFPYNHAGANYWQNWEYPVRFDYIDDSGKQELSFSAGVKVFGQYSRAKDQKSLSINLKDKFGPKEIVYNFFGETAVTNVFSGLVLRNSGQDCYNAHIRDAFCAKATLGVLNVDVMDYQPVIVYINGEYFGLYDLRERITEDYAANRTGADPEDIDLIKGNKDVQNGTIDAYRELTSFLEKNSLANEENYKKACEMVDVDNLIDYWICVSFYSNTDSGNIKFYRPNVEGGKWRWILYDCDWGLYPSTYDWNMIEEVLNPRGHGVGDAFSTLIMNSFLKNSGFKEKFISRYAECLNTVFAPERLTALLDAMVAEIEPEMQAYIDRWDYEEDYNKMACPPSYNRWVQNCQRLREIVAERNTLSRKHLASYFKLSSAEQERLGL